VAETAQVLKGRVLKKKFVLPIEFWIFIFFHFFFCSWFSMMPSYNHNDLNVKSFIFFKKFYKVHSVEVLNQDPCQQKRILAHS
jgi:hypothetical protein